MSCWICDRANGTCEHADGSVLTDKPVEGINLAAFLAGEGRHSIDFPDDIKRLREEIPELKNASDHDVQTLYSGWSEYNYDAQWLSLDEEYVREFWGWLREKAGDGRLYLVRMNAWV